MLTYQRRFIALAATACTLLAAACGPGGPAPSASSAPAAAQPARTSIEHQPIAGGPVLLRSGISLRKVVDAGAGSIRLARSPLDGALYALNPASGVYKISLAQPGAATLVARASTIVTDALPAGMAFGPDGTLFVVANRAAGATRTRGVISKGTPAAEGFSWQNFATTATYPLSNTPFDHLFNGIAVGPDGAYVFVNSGSRTDHGEVEANGAAYPDTREVPLTSAIFRLPADAANLQLPADAAGLQPYLFADGTRNAYDLEFAPNGELFAGDNGPDADYPDELNWLRAGMHYGFPWRFGTQDNPQQFAGYDPSSDRRLHSDFTAVKNGAYHNDPSFPRPPGAFADPVVNRGPAAAQYRDDTGQARDAAAEGRTLSTFTPHRSPLGLAFAGPAMPADLRGQGEQLSLFMLSWGAAGGTLTDVGKDLLHLRLAKQAGNYQASVEQFARDFKNPIDAVLIGNRLYVLEYGGESTIWELTFE